MNIFEITLLVLNGLLLWGFAVAFFSRKETNVKLPGLIFGIIALCNIFYVLKTSGII